MEKLENAETDNKENSPKTLENDSSKIGQIYQDS